ncbi:hypothetical protein LEMLEM_LOCUS19979, partial [Lemmus lemmus]
PVIQDLVWESKSLWEVLESIPHRHRANCISILICFFIHSIYEVYINSREELCWALPRPPVGLCLQSRFTVRSGNSPVLVLIGRSHGHLR